MTIAADAAPDSMPPVGALSLGDGASPARIAALRAEVAQREDALADVQARIKTTRSGRASVRLAATRFLENASRDEKRSSAPVLPRERSGAVSSLLSKWNQGIEKEVERTKVTLRGDVRGAQRNFTGRDAPRPPPAARPFSTPAAAAPPRRGPEAAELLVEEEGSVPAWARNQSKKVIRKENARSSTRGVDLGERRSGVLAARPVDVSGVREEPRVGGNVAAALAMWGRAADEEAKKLEAKNVVQEARREEERKQREREEELVKARAEQERIEAEKRAKAEAEERARRVAAEKKRLEEERRRTAEASKKAKEEEIRKLRSLATSEPAGGKPAELVEWLELRIKLLDLLIAEAEAELAELEKNV